MIRPFLSIVWNFDPVFVSFGSFDIRFYGVMWALAILIGAQFFSNFCKREGLPSSVSDSIFVYGTLATIIGARLGHCLFMTRWSIFASRGRSSRGSAMAG